jgi:hypothetical protein
MYNFNEDAIREAAYFIWKNNGCQANTSLSDWDAAINQLASQASLKLKAPKKAAASLKVLMPKKKEVKSINLKDAKSIILKPASAPKATASTKTTAKKTIILKAKTTAKKNTNKKSK